jgi:Protein of unknown function (DUF1629)
MYRGEQMSEKIWEIHPNGEFPPVTWVNHPSGEEEVLPFGPYSGLGSGWGGAATGFWAGMETPHIRIDLRSVNEHTAYRTDPEAPVVLPQCTGFQRPGMMLASETVKDALEAIDGAAFEFCACRTEVIDDKNEQWYPGPKFWIADLTRVLDAIDVEKSESYFKILSDNINRVLHLFGSKNYFHANVIGNERIFLQQNCSFIFGTDLFKDQMEATLPEVFEFSLVGELYV